MENMPHLLFNIKNRFNDTSDKQTNKFWKLFAIIATSRILLSF